ncbi:glycosyltransferase family 2 protein [Patescibacteria group bacterium]
MKTLSIIIPVFNEEKTVEKVLSQVFAQKTPGWNKQVIVVDDGSKDKTRDKLKNWETKCQVFYQKKNHGKGRAVSTAFKYIKGDIVMIQDADLEYPPSNYPVLLKPFENENVDVVYGSRFLGAHLSTMFVYAMGNKFVTLITNILYNTNITDMETGFKVFRKDVIKEIVINAKRFDFEPEFTAKVLKNGYQIYEVPISYYGRKFSEGKKLTWRDGIMAFWTLIKYRFIQ